MGKEDVFVYAAFEYKYIKKINKTSLFVYRIIYTDVDGLDSWSKLQIIDSIQPMVGFYYTFNICLISHELRFFVGEQWQTVGRIRIDSLNLSDEKVNFFKEIKRV